MHSIPNSLLVNGKYGDFHIVTEDEKLSIQDIATLKEVVESAMKDISIKDITGIVKNHEGKILLVLKSDDSDKEMFDFYSFINAHKDVDVLLNCVNIKYVCNNKYSRGLVSDLVTEDVEEDYDEGTGYISQSEIQRKISNDIPLKLVFCRTGESRLITAKPFSVGRSKKDVDFKIDNTNLTRVHCFIHLEEKGVVLVDNGSLNGTFVNGIKCEPRKEYIIHKDDILYLADEKFVIE